MMLLLESGIGLRAEEAASSRWDLPAALEVSAAGFFGRPERKRDNPWIWGKPAAPKVRHYRLMSPLGEDPAVYVEE